jgi:MoxR-like ATPase
VNTIRNELAALAQNVEKVIVGKRDAIDLACITLLCKGHLLIEDVPGLGKTMLARSIAGSLALHYKRVQFTPDLLPSDITGVSIFNQKKGEFEFKPGPGFTNILLADEINRTTPRTQSSLLECMEESQVTVDGNTYVLPKIFMVIATQNPIELQGTYPLPEAQLDRFFMRIKIGYPSIDQEMTIMEMQSKEHPIASLSAVSSQEQITAMQESVKKVQIDKSINKYIASIVEATRRHPHVSLGASPRGSLGVMRASQAMAALKGLQFVEPSLVKHVVQPVLAHRILVKPQSRLGGMTSEKVLNEVLESIPVPV